ncbi:hypothetical protein [Aldersonia kunmingensis]|uniref:hypothetical protein n=1 Tax=Aldersonia kunmingensis TaxID=408066 RepID=UPI00082DC21B|nr:hypothetical protein [Aldersonia kunmingensis]
MRSNYSQLGARTRDTAPADPGDPGTPLPSLWSGTFRWVTVGLVALIVLAVIAACVRGCTAAGDDTTAGEQAGIGVPIRTAHGPSTIVDGVPNGYTRDPDGAATAAVNTVQALDDAAAGRIRMGSVESTRIASAATTGLRKLVDDGKKPVPNAGTLTVAPAAVTVTSYSDDAAKVSIWQMSTSQYSITPGDPKAVRVAWSTDEVSLVWENGDWKVQDKTFRTGPDPSDPAVTAPPADSALADPVQQGYYSFYVN